MSEDTLLPLEFPAVGRKKVVAAFDGGRLTSDGGVLLPGAIERELGVARTLAALIPDTRNLLLVTRSVQDILRARMLAIACGYEDGDDLDHLRTDPGFKLACGRLPDSGTDLCLGLIESTQNHFCVLRFLGARCKKRAPGRRH